MIEHTEEWEEMTIGDIFYGKVTVDVEIDQNDHTSWDYQRMLLEYESEDGSYISSEIVDYALCDGMEYSQRTICRKRAQHRFKELDAALRADLARWLDFMDGIQQAAHEHNQPDPDFLYDQSRDDKIDLP